LQENELKVLTAADTIEWLSWFARFPDPSGDYVHCDGKGLFFTHPDANCIDLEYPPKLERLPFFVRFLAAVGYEDRDFEGALLWFTEWGVWNSRDEAMGCRIVESMHRAAGQPKSFEAAPGHLFRGDELQDAVAMLIQPMIFGFDAYYLPRWSYGTGEFFLYVSHDSYVTVVTRTKEFHDRVFGLLKELNLNPVSGSKLRVQRFCRVSPEADGGSQ
jgi:hypothetical protein